MVADGKDLVGAGVFGVVLLVKGSSLALSTMSQTRELYRRIDKLVKYSTKNCPEFVAMIREKQQDNPDYAFLFGGEGLFSGANSEFCKYKMGPDQHSGSISQNEFYIGAYKDGFVWRTNKFMDVCTGLMVVLVDGGDEHCGLIAYAC